MREVRGEGNRGIDVQAGPRLSGLRLRLGIGRHCRYVRAGVSCRGCGGIGCVLSAGREGKDKDEKKEKKFQVLAHGSDAPLTDCPACGKPELKRLVSAAAFRLKGGGWYETDFKKDNRRNVADSGDDKPKADSKKEGGSAPEPPKKSDKASDASGGSKPTEKASA